MFTTGSRALQRGNCCTEHLCQVRWGPCPAVSSLLTRGRCMQDGCANKCLSAGLASTKCLPDALPAYSCSWLKDFLMGLSLLNVLITLSRNLFHEERFHLGNMQNLPSTATHCQGIVWRLSKLSLGFSP